MGCQIDLSTLIGANVGMRVVDLCIDACADMSIDVCGHAHTDMCIVMHEDMCCEKCMDNSAERCAQIRIHMLHIGERRPWWRWRWRRGGRWPW